MSADTPLIKVDGVWKTFRRGEPHASLRDAIPRLVRRIVGGPSPTQPGGLGAGEFWALRDLSFSVGPGEALGIIGANGAGKSTVLKVLSRILRPTRGSYMVRGRIGSLIEIAAGFHPDLTGRENIFLQGAIMGIARLQIRRKLDEIIAFSGVAEFIDSPVKRYSSGMNARLGFAIAANLEPDVLLLDEALSVGDYAFQRKAFDRIAELGRSGMPIVVVSHQLDRIATLCTHALLLSRGETVCVGPPADVIGTYLRTVAASVAVDGGGDSPVSVETVSLVGGGNVPSGDHVRFRVAGHVHRPVTSDVEPVGIIVRSAQSGESVFATGTTLHALTFSPGAFSLDVSLQMNLPPGIYVVEIGVWERTNEKQLMTGPSVSVNVLEGTMFLGSVNLNPAMSLATGARAAVGAHA